VSKHCFRSFGDVLFQDMPIVVRRPYLVTRAANRKKSFELFNFPHRTFQTCHINGQHSKKNRRNERRNNTNDQVLTINIWIVGVNNPINQGIKICHQQNNADANRHAETHSRIKAEQK